MKEPSTVLSKVLGGVILVLTIGLVAAIPKSGGVEEEFLLESPNGNHSIYGDGLDSRIPVSSNVSVLQTESRRLTGSADERAAPGFEQEELIHDPKMQNEPFYDSLEQYFENYLDSHATSGTVLHTKIPGAKGRRSIHHIRLETAIRLRDAALVTHCLDQYNFSPVDLKRALLQACESQSRELILILLEHKVDPNICQGAGGYTLLHFAVDVKDREMVQALVAAGADITAKAYNRNALERAASQGDADTLLLLLSADPGTDQSIGLGKRFHPKLPEQTGTKFAANGQPATPFAHVMPRSEEPESNFSESSGIVHNDTKAAPPMKWIQGSAMEQRPLNLEHLHYSMDRDDLQGVLVALGSVDVKLLPKGVWGSLLNFAVDERCLTLVRILLDAPHDVPGCVGRSKMSLVSLGAMHNDLELLKILVKRGEKLNRVYNRRTPIQWATRREHFQIAEYLFYAGADICRDQSTAHVLEQWALLKGKIQLAKLIEEKRNGCP